MTTTIIVVITIVMTIINVVVGNRRESSPLLCVLHSGRWSDNETDAFLTPFEFGCPALTVRLIETHERNVVERLCKDKRPPLRALRFTHNCSDVPLRALARATIESDTVVVSVGDSLQRQAVFNSIRCEIENARAHHAHAMRVMFRDAPLILSIKDLLALRPPFRSLLSDEETLARALVPAVTFSLSSNWTLNNVLVLNTGAWWSPSAIARQGVTEPMLTHEQVSHLFRATILAIVIVLREISPHIGLIVWMATLPPHPLCDGVTRPQGDWNWNENAGERQSFALENMRQLRRELDNFVILDATRLLSTRADAHPGAGDCLHFCMLSDHSPLRAIAHILLAEIADRQKLFNPSQR